MEGTGLHGAAGVAGSTALQRLLGVVWSIAFAMRQGAVQTGKAGRFLQEGSNECREPGGGRMQPGASWGQPGASVELEALT